MGSRNRRIRRELEAEGRKLLLRGSAAIGLMSNDDLAAFLGTLSACSEDRGQVHLYNVLARRLRGLPAVMDLDHSAMVACCSMALPGMHPADVAEIAREVAEHVPPDAGELALLLNEMASRLEDQSCP